MRTATTMPDRAVMTATVQTAAESDRAEGTRRIYRADPKGLHEVRAQLDRFWSQTLANFKELVESQEDG